MQALGCADICFVFQGTVDEYRKMLDDAGAPIIRGPVACPGGRGRGTVPSLSLYARDPDDNCNRVDLPGHLNGKESHGHAVARPALQSFSLESQPGETAI